MAGKRGGFTYAELLTALAICAVLAVPLFPMLMQAGANHSGAAAMQKAQYEADALAAAAAAVLRTGFLDNLQSVVNEFIENLDGGFCRVTVCDPASSEAARYFTAGAANGSEPPPGPFAFEGSAAGAVPLMLKAEIFFDGRLSAEAVRIVHAAASNP
ncbi:MAG: hypothetical protein FWE82_05285 [Defluviitaleaceae bacterium]|nr:hypothetical protein [Defluviitaleaceae bacterium]